MNQNKFEVGDIVWWFESECGGHWTKRFFAEDIYVCQGIFEGVDDKGYARIKDCKTEYSAPEKYYKSKNEAIISAINYLQTLLDKDKNATP